MFCVECFEFHQLFSKKGEKDFDIPIQLIAKINGKIESFL